MNDEAPNAERRHRPDDQGEPGRPTEEDGGDGPSDQRLTPWQIISSTVAAAFGVQSSRNRERDFSRGKASHFIIAGVVFTVLFVLGVVVVVKLVLATAG